MRSCCFWTSVVSENAGRLTGKPRTTELLISVASNSNIMRNTVSSRGVRSAVTVLGSRLAKRWSNNEFVAMLYLADGPGHSQGGPFCVFPEDGGCYACEDADDQAERGGL